MGDAFWLITKNAYKIPKNGPSTIDELRDVEHNIQAKEALSSALTDTELANVLELKTAHEIWNKLENLYEGDKYVKCAKL